MIDENKKFFIIEKAKYEHINDTYSIHKDKMYDLTTAVRIMLALDTLNEDRKRISYHLQEVSFSVVQEPLVLTKEMEVKETQSEMPF
jgi:hypothetical protein